MAERKKEYKESEHKGKKIKLEKLEGDYFWEVVG